MRQGHTASTPGRDAPISLPFLDKKTYYLDALSMPMVPIQDDTPEAQMCRGTICHTRPESAFDSTIGLHRTRSSMTPSDHEPQASQPALPERFRALQEKSAYVGLVDAGMLMVMRQLPATFTKWTADRYTEETPLRQWQKHISTPPVMDNDIPMVNISHAYSGSGYYTLCRNTPEFSGQETQHMLECLGYAVVMSTLWEYLPEAFMEVPSIQDLVVTPLGGAVLGELFYQLQQKIMAHDRQLFGSAALGSVAIVLLNPLEELVQAMQGLVGPLGEAVDLRAQLAYGNITPHLLHTATEPTQSDTTLFIQIAGRWPGKRLERRR
jgi:hypothetical protein